MSIRQRRAAFIGWRSRWFPLCWLVLFLSLALPVRAPAQMSLGAGEPADIQLRIEGADTGTVDQEVPLKGVATANATGEFLLKGAQMEWVLDGRVIQRGDTMRCRAGQPGVYQFTLNLTKKINGGVRILATDTHTLTFGRARAPAPAPVRAPAPLPEILPTPTPAAARPAPTPAPVEWALVRTEDKQDTKWTEDKNTVSLSGPSFEGVNRRPCGGFAISKVSWSDPPTNLVPGSVLSVKLSEELELAADTSAGCPSNLAPFRATTIGKFSSSYAYHHEQSTDAISEGARASRERFTKTKLVKWRVPAARAGESMTLEIGGEGPAGSASKLYIYECVERPVAQVAAAPRPAPALAPVPAAPPAPAPAPAVAAPVTAPAPRPAAAPGALTVRLLSDKTVYQAGDDARISVGVEGGKGPYRFMWSGNVAAAARGRDAVTVTLPKPGEIQVWVRATDLDGNTSTDLLAVVVQPLPLELVKDDPFGNSLYLEESGRFHVELPPNTPLPSSPFVFQWRSEPQVAFEPAEGTQRVTVAKFTRPGRVQVWATVRRDIGGLLEKLGESQRIDMEVQPAQVQAAVYPAEPYVGQEARAQLTVTPEVSGIQFRWGPLPANVTQLAESSDGRELTFLLKDDRPAEIPVTAETTTAGDLVGRTAARVTARTYDVRVSGPTAAGPLPELWKPGVGLVSAGQAIAVRQAVAFRASVSPQPEATPLRYAWRADSRNCSISNAGTPEAILVCSETGDYQLGVKVTDTRGVEIGNGTATFAVTISQADLDGARRQAQAKKLRDDAADLLKMRRTAEAIAKYKESLAAWPNKEVETHVAMLEAEASRQEAAKAKARKLRAEAAVLEQQGRLAEALAKLRESLVSAPDAAVERRAAGVQARLAQQEAVKARAAKLKAEGHGFEQQGSLTEAISRYKQSLSAWPDESLRKRIYALESEIARQQAVRSQVARLKVEAAGLEQQGKLSAAIAKYQESLKLIPDEPLKKRVLELQADLDVRKARAEKARLVIAEAYGLEKAGEIEGALAKYRESQTLWPGTNVAAHIVELQAGLDRRRAEEETKRARAAALKSEASALEQQGRLADALAKYRASLAVLPDEAIAAQLPALEAKLAEADARKARVKKLAEEGQGLEAEGKAREAIAKYKESLAVAPDPGLEARVAALEKELAKQELDRAQARRLVNEGTALEQLGRLKDAAAKFRESLALQPDPELETRAAALEKQAAQEEADRTRALALKTEGQALEQGGSVKEAIARYRESLKVRADADLEAHTTSLEEDLAREEADQARALKLAEVALELEMKGELRDAAAKFRESLALRPNTQLLIRVSNIEDDLRKQEAEKILAEAARHKEEGQALEESGEWEAAIRKYEESLGVRPDRGLEKRLAALKKDLVKREQVRARALKLRDEAVALEEKGELQAALAKYQGSLSVWSNAEVQAQSQALADRMAAEAEAKLREQARLLKEEAVAFESRGEAKEALAKYREALAVRPDQEIADLMTRLENKLAEEERNRALARQLKDEAYAFELKGSFKEAAAKYRESLRLQADAELEQHTAALEKQVSDEEALQARLRAIADEARGLEQAGDLKAAIEKYREALAVRPDKKMDALVASLEKRLAKQEEEKRIAQARSAKEEAKMLEQEGELRQAIERYRQSLNLAPDPALEQHVKEIEAALTAAEARQLEADRLREEAAALLTQNNLPEAIAKYRESLKLIPDQELQGHVTMLEAEVARQEAEKAKTRQLLEEAAALEQAGKPREAIAKYRESLAVTADAALAARVQEMEAALAQQESDQARAAKLRDEGAALEEAGRIKEAVGKYKESLALGMDQELADRLAALDAGLVRQEADRQAAARLNEQAAAFEKAGKLDEAIDTYRESLGLWPDDALGRRVAALEDRLSQREAQKLRERLQALRRQAGVLEKRGNLAEAVAKYRESVGIQPDPKIEARIAELEQRMAEQEAKVSAEEARRAEAGTIREAAIALEKQGNLSEAVAGYRKSLAIQPDAALEAHTARLEEQIKQQEAEKILARLREINAAGRGLEEQGDLRGAIAKYREALALKPNSNLEAHVAELEQQAAEQEARLAAEEAQRAEMAKAKEAGLALEKQGSLAEAVAAYREVLATQPDAALELHIVELEEQIKVQEAEKAFARMRQLHAEGRTLEQQGDLKAAIAKYRESLTIKPDVHLDAHIADLEQAVAVKEAQIATFESNRLEAAKVREEALDLERQGKLSEALERYQHSLALAPDAETEKRSGAIEAELVLKEVNRNQAEEFAEQGRILEDEGNGREALALYRRSLSNWPNEELKAHADELAARLGAKTTNEARRLRFEAYRAEQEGDLSGAIPLYQQSLKLVPDADLARRAADLQRQLKERDNTRASADRLWQQGLALEKINRPDEAVRKFKRSLKLVSSPEREKYAAQVAAKTAPQEQVGARTSSGTARRTRTARAEAAAARYPDLAGTAWQGVILIPTPKGTMQWPLQFSVDEDNKIALAYKVQHAATGEMMGFLVRGTYDPADQRFALQFTRTQGRNTLTGTLNGRAQSATAAGGQAALDGPTPGQGVWRVSAAN